MNTESLDISIGARLWYQGSVWFVAEHDGGGVLLRSGETYKRVRGASLVDGEVGGGSAAADQGLTCGGLVDTVGEQALVDMDADYLPEDHTGHCLLPLGSGQRDDLGGAAFENCAGLGHMWSADHPGLSRGQPGQLEFVHLGTHLSGCRVHGGTEGFADQVPAEFSRGLSIGQGVLGSVAGEADDRWDVVEGVEEAVGGQVQPPGGVLGGDPSDGSRGDDGVERRVPQSMSLGGFVEVVLAVHRQLLDAHQRLGPTTDLLRSC